MDKGIKVFIGGIYMVSGILLYGFVHLAAVSNYGTGTWSNKLVRYLEAITDTAGLIPVVFALAFIILGLKKMNA